MPGNVRKDIQLAVDEYLRLYQQQKAIKEELDALKEVIEPYMKDQGFAYIAGSDGRCKVELSAQERPVMNARYTTYDVAEVASLLSPALRKKCVVEVVDKEKLEALYKLGEISDDIYARKHTKTTYSFSVRMTN